MKSSILSFILLTTFAAATDDAALTWKKLSSKQGDLPEPGPSTEQTGAMVGDLDKDGVNDFLITARQAAPAIVWYRRNQDGWSKYVVENRLVPIEAGGTLEEPVTGTLNQAQEPDPQ